MLVVPTDAPVAVLAPVKVHFLPLVVEAGRPQGHHRLSLDVHQHIEVTQAAPGDKDLQLVTSGED